MAMLKPKLPDNRGMTLVEAIVASVLLAIGALVLSTGFIAATRMMTISAADKKSAQTVAAEINMDGAVTETDTDTVTLTIGDGSVQQRFSVDVRKKKFSADENESITFYMWESNGG